MGAIAFDTLEYVHELKKAGVPEKQAEAQAHALIKVVAEDLATKHGLKELETTLKYDLKKLETALEHDLKELELRFDTKLAELKTDIIKWNVGTVFAAVGLFATIMKLLG